MAHYNVGQFDIVGKPKSWHTAFYYLAEHLRILSNGAINHKTLYSLVGVDGRYINHNNPLVRKRTAGALSRIVHSGQYAKHMRTRFLQNGLAFSHASQDIITQLLDDSTLSATGLLDYLVNDCWPDVQRGLRNEKESYRPMLNSVRIGEEIDALFARYYYCEKGTEQQCINGAASILSAYFHLIAFGHLEIVSARNLTRETIQPNTTSVDTALFSLNKSHDSSYGSDGLACLVRYSGDDYLSLTGWWIVSSQYPFVIGRFTDCDAIETNRYVSRIHCCVYFKGDTWYFEDLNSRCGSTVIRNTRGGTSETIVCDAKVPVPIQPGDCFELANSSYYWFGKVTGAGLQNIPKRREGFFVNDTLE